LCVCVCIFFLVQFVVTLWLTHETTKKPIGRRSKPKAKKKKEKNTVTIKKKRSKNNKHPSLEWYEKDNNNTKNDRQTDKRIRIQHPLGKPPRQGQPPRWEFPKN